MRRLLLVLSLLALSGPLPAGDPVLDRYEALIEEMLAAPGGDARRIAAALARIASRERPLEVSGPEPAAVPLADRSRRFPGSTDASFSPRGRRGERGPRRGDSGRPAARHTGG